MWSNENFKIAQPSINSEKTSSSAHIFQVCSLDQEGNIVIWSIIAKQNQDVTQNGGIAYWGRMVLMKNFEISLRHTLPDLDELLCNDMFIASGYPTCAFVGTNYGSVLQCELNKEKTQLKIHTPGERHQISTLNDNSTIFSADIPSPVKCLVPCPFSSIHFLAGLENGTIVLYSRKSVKPLMVITNKESKVMDDSIEEIQWSFEKPCIFYTKNSSQVIDAWDLSKSSVFPMESMRFEEEITCMKLAQSNMDKSFMVSDEKRLINLEHQ